ncbi:MAG: radical SAM protein [Planctomycetaceae bacterium]|nr:radical SAM protein [Planctomycetaceae bacterium]
MLRGLVFDIREFAVHDGPGIRTTVCLKGCPLHCSWCHNPEGISPSPQTLKGMTGDRTVGQWFESDRLASLLNRQADVLRRGHGGVTFSGGEPLAQAAFVAEVIERLDSLHTALDTSGYGTEADFRGLAARVDLVLFDLKLMDPVLHHRYTGCDNAPILRNFERLTKLETPYIVRVPMTPGVTDARANLTAMAEFLRNRPNLQRVELLPYNRAAGGKYAAAGMVFEPDFDETQAVRPDLTIFLDRGVPAVLA